MAGPKTKASQRKHFKGPQVAAMLEGKVEAEGDLNLLGRLGEMFGGPSGF